MKRWQLRHLLQYIKYLFTVLFYFYSEGNGSSKSSKSSGGGGSSGGSGGKKGPNPWWQSFYETYQQQIWLAVGLSFGAGYLLMSSGTPVREINWQEFRTNYLEKGDVSALSSQL